MSCDEETVGRGWMAVLVSLALVGTLSAQSQRAEAVKITDVEGIGPAFGEKLNAAGVQTTDDLLEHGATRKGRQDLADQSGLTGAQILEWVNRVDLYRIKGVGSEYSDLLELAGVDTVVELARRNAANLADTFQSVAAERPDVVRRVPGQAVVAGWIEEAKKLPRVVEY